MTKSMTLIALVMLIAAQISTAYAADAPAVDDVLDKLRLAPSNEGLLGQLAQASMKEMAEEKKAKALTICYAGYYLLNKPQIAEKAKAALVRDCAMSSYVEMLETNSFVVAADCGTCKGAKSTEVMCKACRNIRFRPTEKDEIPPTKCHGCNGEGWRPGIGNKRNKCASCLGKKICVKCNGSGKQKEPCKDCKTGKTSTFDKKKALAMYKSLLNE